MTHVPHEPLLDWIIAGAGALWLLAVVVVWLCACGARPGWEDRDGFHPGDQP